MSTLEQRPALMALNTKLLMTLAAGIERQQRVKRLQITRKLREMQCCLCLSGIMRRPT